MNKRFFEKHGATILTVLGGVGVAATAVVTAKAAIKANDILEEAKEEKGEDLTKWETVKAVGPTYVAPLLIAGTTITCIVGANLLNKKTQASLASAYALLDQSYRKYRNKVKDIYGEEAHQEIINAITIEEAEDIYMYSSCLGSSCDMSIEEHDSEPRRFYDEYSNRYFMATIEQVIAAEYHLNRNYTLRGYAVLNEFYDFLGISPTDGGSELGWAVSDEGTFWIDFNHRKIEAPDGEETYIIEMPFGPTLEWTEYY